MDDLFSRNDEMDRLAGQVSEERLQEIAATYEEDDTDDLFRQGVMLGKLTQGGTLPIWCLNPVQKSEDGEEVYGPEFFFVGSRETVCKLLRENAGK